MPQYNGVWTLEAQAQALTNQQWVTDPNFKNTTLLLQADGTGSGSQNNTFLDSSTNNFFINRNGNTTQGSFSPFSQAPGYWGNYFNGASNLNALSNAAYNASTGDFCVEAWVYNTTAASALQVYVVCSGGISLYRTAAGYLEFAKDGVAAYATSSSFIPVNQWSHVVAARSGTTLKLFIDGAQVASVTNSISFPAGNLAIGSTYAGASYHTGYLSNVRYVVGSPVYTAAFTPQTTPLTPITNTVLLTSQSNRFVDNSTTANTINVSSATQVQAFGPFAPALQWTPTVVGGSGYFDGNGDYLKATATTIGSGDFTIECWVYLNSIGVDRNFINMDVASTSTNVSLSLDSTTNKARFLIRNDASTTNLDINSSVALVTNTWYHIVGVANGTTGTLYVNGSSTLGATGTITGTRSGSGTQCRIGVNADDTTRFMNGYISSARIVKGAVVYTANFTPPTAPLTAIANTSILLNFTNAGIYDGKMANNLETVGNAQVATSPVKYGSGSMYFDGTGDWLSIPSSGAALTSSALGQGLTLGSGNFTIELWMNASSFASTRVLVNYGYEGTTQRSYLVYIDTSSNLHFAYSTNGTGNTDTTLGSTGIVTSSWIHIAIVRNNTIVTGYVNGIALATTVNISTNTIVTSTGEFTIGSDKTNSFVGYLDDLRVTKGVARYTANFTPPQQALPRQ